jgi:hypothetical protein
MRAKLGFAVLLFLLLMTRAAYPQDHSANDKVHWCSTIPIPEVWREAQFTAVFVLDVDANGKPVHIKGISLPPFVDDRQLISCISSWSIPSVSGKVTAEFRWKWSCLDIWISSNGKHRTFPCQPPKPTT